MISPRRMSSVTTRRGLAFASALLLLTAGALAAQEGYRDPPAPIPAILDAAPMPLTLVSPDRARIALLERRALPPISEVAAPELRLAGDRIDPARSIRSRAERYVGLSLKEIATGVTRAVTLPPGASIAYTAWSPRGDRLAAVVLTDAGLTLWVVGTDGSARQVSPRRLNGVFDMPCDWLPAGDALVCLTVPEARGAPPAAPTVPTGPIIQFTSGRAAPNRTYQDLLQSPHDEALFEFYFTSQLARIGLDGNVTPIGAPGIHAQVSPSPDGRYLLVRTLHRPFSYLVPAGRFPARVEVWGLDGQVVKALADVPLQEDIPPSFDAVQDEPRQHAWRADAPATVIWLEALDGGNPARPAPRRDRMVALAAPFTGAPVTLFEAEFRLGGFLAVRPDLALVNERWQKTRRARTWIINPSDPAAAPRLLFDRSSEDRYADPGSFVLMPGSSGRVLTTPDGKSAFLTGDGASPEGDRPFLDRIDLATGRITRLWRVDGAYYEQPLALLDPEGRRVLTRRESETEVPNLYVRDLRRNTLARITDFTDPAPQFAGVSRQLIRYTRSDGVELSATLYLPAGYDKSKGPLPFLFWAYPREFRSAAAAAQVTGSPYRFVRPTGASHLFLLTQGYGILDGPTMPIVGAGDAEPNDTYVEQLVASAEAAVNKVVEMGVADRSRIAIGGHSYGAFMTANLLAHSDLFRTGIARSGAYNRTLTPFGFQAEERTYWEAPETYTRMSPFTYANRINEPILFIHGEADDNSGTFPIQSERMYAAIKGNGGTARYVVLPAEAHGYRARESVGHTLWEMINWLDTHLGPRQTTSTP
ncbi:MAG: prolyl oligopeptidase family serine peptidase [Gemmatimonadota bacterium]